MIASHPRRVRRETRSCRGHWVNHEALGDGVAAGSAHHNSYATTPQKRTRSQHSVPTYLSLVEQCFLTPAARLPCPARRGRSKPSALCHPARAAGKRPLSCLGQGETAGDWDFWALSWCFHPEFPLHPGTQALASWPGEPRGARCHPVRLARARRRARLWGSHASRHLYATSCATPHSLFRAPAMALLARCHPCPRRARCRSQTGLVSSRPM